MTRIFSVFVVILLESFQAAADLPTCSSSQSRRDTLDDPSHCEKPYRGADWFGGDLNQTAIEGVGDAINCCHKCRETPDCIAYIYRIDFDHCYLKGMLNDPSPCDMCEGLNFLEPAPPEGCNPEKEKYRPGGDIPGMPLITTDPGWCCTQCQNIEGCVSWSWRRDSNHCFLKNERNAKVDCSACITGDLDASESQSEL